MRLQILQTALPGLAWMRRYYTLNPQLNRTKAFQAYEDTKRRISNFPPPKANFEDFEKVWEAKIFNTAFSILYTIRRNTIYIIDIRDQRGQRSYLALKKYAQELRQQLEN